MIILSNNLCLLLHELLILLWINPFESWFAPSSKGWSAHVSFRGVGTKFFCTVEVKMCHIKHRPIGVRPGLYPLQLGN